MRGTAWLALAFVAVGAAGCIGTDETATDDPAADATGTVLAPPLAAAAWNDPQQAPHPAFGWPTITHVPADAPAWWQPIPARALPEEIAGFEHVASGEDGYTGDGIGVFGSLALTAAPDASAQLYDLRDPADPKVLSVLELGLGTRQSLMIPYGDGRLVAAFATGSGQVPLWDITDPEHPLEITVLEMPNSGHTIANVPGTPILYNANAAGSLPFFAFDPTASKGGQTEIVDLSDPANPVLVQEWKNGIGCHAISFHITSERQRAYCAGVDYTQIWDIADPLAPTIVSTFPAPHAVAPAPGFPILVTVSHWAVVNEDATILAIADEMGGGALMACDVYAEPGGRPVSGPMGNVWFYDISDETTPELLGWVSPSAPPVYGRQGSCTAHIGRLVPHAEKDLLVMSFYSGGLALIDFTDPSAPAIVDHWTDGTPMDAWYYNGYVIAGDAGHSIDVLTFV